MAIGHLGGPRVILEHRAGLLDINVGDADRSVPRGAAISAIPTMTASEMEGARLPRLI
jgi:hypothetical protein